MPSKKDSIVNYTHVMVDLETVGKRAGCGVLSIGAVAFDPASGTLGPEFYQVVRIADCEALGLHSDPSTIAWWEGQSKEAQKVLKQARGSRGTKTLEKSLQSFNMYLAQFGGRRNVKVWVNGSDFDNAILYACYAAVEMESWLGILEQPLLPYPEEPVCR